MDRKHSWEVICVSYREDTDHEDCRALEDIGYLAPTLKTKQVDSVGSMIDSGLSRFHLELDGRRVPLKAARDGKYYVRVKDEDTSDDPLLNLPTIEEYRNEQKFKR